MKKKQDTIFIIILLLILLACGTLWQWADETVRHVPSDDGTRDLRNADFSSGSYDLFGAMEYIPNALLTPDEFEMRRDEILVGTQADSVLYSTIRLRLYVPVGTYGLIMWNAGSAANIYLNGQLVENVGIPASDAALSVPGRRLIYYTVDTRDGVVEILQQTSNYAGEPIYHYTDIVIGMPEAVREMYTKQNTIPAIVMGCFLALFLTHLVLYSLRRSYRANLLFAVFCLVWFVRTGYVHPWILSSLLPLSRYTISRLYYLTHPLGMLLVCIALETLLPGVIQKWFRRVMTAICAAFACVYVFIDTAYMPEVLPYIYAAIVFALVYIIARICLKLRKPDIEQLALLAGMGVFMFGALYDIVFYNVIPAVSPAAPAIGNVSGRTMIEYALLVFLFFQMAVMFRATMREIVGAKEKEKELMMENALLAREADMREDMVRDLSHEVRTPLTVISTYTQLAVRQFRQGKIDEQIIDGLDAVYTEAMRIADLASNTLSPRESDERIADLAEITRQLVRLHTPMAQAAGRSINMNLSNQLLTTCNVGEITQVIWNLLGNAIKHGEHGDIDVDGNESDEYVYVIITDYGAGIPPDMLPIVFERGVSGKDGSGLGLAIANEIVQNHGGKLIIESEYGLGTTATLLLPAYRRKERTQHEK